MEKIAAAVVLYNPDENTFIRNIPSYAPFSDLLILIDNSDNKKLDYSNYYFENTQVIYIDNKGNLGIAKALNQAADKAIEKGYKWLLTMDQDSWFETNNITALINIINIINQDNTAILSPVHITTGNIQKISDNILLEKSSVMTSGNLLNLKLFKAIGNFREDYFIDYVDHEYCFRARAKGYKIIGLSNVYLNHSLGNTQEINIPGIGSYTISNHSALRKYYLIRNLLYFRKQYIHLFKSEVIAMFKDEVKTIIKILLFEKGKLKKMKMILNGIQDYRKGITGKFQKV